MFQLKLIDMVCGPRPRSPADSFSKQDRSNLPTGSPITIATSFIRKVPMNRVSPDRFVFLLPWPRMGDDEQTFKLGKHKGKLFSRPTKRERERSEAMSLRLVVV